MQQAIEIGRFITFEGGEGAGKSTQVGILADRLSRSGLPVFVLETAGKKFMNINFAVQKTRKLP